MSRNFDQQMLRRAIALATRGRGAVEPNPMVACVIVKDGRVIGEGHHARFGGPHAEPTALAACVESPRGATSYVTLEPCCHTNKKTPPCAPRLIEAGVARVVVGCLDPNPAVNGNGVAMLRAAGIAVDGPAVEDECRQLIAPFIKKQLHRRPYVTLKWAQSADGKVAGPGGARVQISNKRSTQLVHDLRGRYVSVVVGIDTVLNDDPMLTPRLCETARPVRRVVLDTRLRIPDASRLVETAREVPTTVFHADDPALASRADALRKLGVETVPLPVGEEGHVSFDAVVRHVGQWDAPEMLVEPGPTLAAALLGTPLVDRLWVFRSPNRIADATAPDAAAVPERYVKTTAIDVGGDVLSEYLNPASPVFFAAEPSADLIIAREGDAA